MSRYEVSRLEVWCDAAEGSDGRCYAVFPGDPTACEQATVQDATAAGWVCADGRDTCPEHSGGKP